MKKMAVIGNTAQWCIESWEGEIAVNPELTFCNQWVPFSGGKFLHRLCHIHYSQKLNKHINFPLHRIWYSNFVKTLNLNAKTKYLVVYDWNLVSRDFGFVQYLHKRFPDLKILYLFSNVCRISGASFYGILPKLKDHYDYVFAFDKDDAKRYGFLYAPLMYMRSDAKQCVEATSDLFYIGQAKDRLNFLHALYEKATREGLRCDFHIVGVTEDNKKYPEGICYNKPIPYSEVLERIKRTRCIVDATQQNSHGLTIKVCEAVIFNKKLISSNSFISEEAFFSSDRILEKALEVELRRFLISPMHEYLEDEAAWFSFKTILDSLNAKGE